ncbi:3-ketoacyl-CoA synthase 17-like [Wolffia australiana]
MTADPSMQPLTLLLEHKLAIAALLCCTAVAVLTFFLSRPPRVFLLDYACYLPPTEHRLSFEVCEYFTRKSGRFSLKSENFMRGIYAKSGLGDETYGPPYVFRDDINARLSSGIEEAQRGAFSAVETVLGKTRLDPTVIDVVVVASGVFAHVPSLSSMLVHRFGLRPNVKTYNLSGMGCSSGAGAVDLAARILAGDRRIKNALIVATENTSLSWYSGDNRSMLVTNCIFRAGCAAAVVTSDGRRRRDAKMELVLALRSHYGADDAAYTAAFQEEDDEGNSGFSLKKELVRVAGRGLRKHVEEMAPKVLPWKELAIAVAGKLGVGVRKPDLMAGFEHACVHTGGKAVVEAVAEGMGMTERMTEPARMTLHRFGNTSCSMVFYELAYFEAMGRIKEGDRVWMISFGTGFKVCSLVWRALKSSAMADDNPWKSCIHRYPLKAW